MGVVALYEQWKRRRLALTLGLTLGVFAKPLAELCVAGRSRSRLEREIPGLTAVRERFGPPSALNELP